MNMAQIAKNTEIAFRLVGKRKPVKGVVLDFVPDLFGGPDLIVVKCKREREITISQDAVIQ